MSSQIFGFHATKFVAWVWWGGCCLNCRYICHRLGVGSVVAFASWWAKSSAVGLLARHSCLCFLFCISRHFKSVTSNILHFELLWSQLVAAAAALVFVAQSIQVSLIHTISEYTSEGRLSDAESFVQLAVMNHVWGHVTLVQIPRVEIHVCCSSSTIPYRPLNLLPIHQHVLSRSPVYNLQSVGRVTWWSLLVTI